MSIRPSQPLADYLAARVGTTRKPWRGASSSVPSCGTEGRTIEGVTAIGRWMEEAKRKYQHTTTPFAVVRRDGKTVVTAKVSGNFPNSPVNLEHVFEIEGDKITSLEIC